MTLRLPAPSATPIGSPPARPAPNSIWHGLLDRTPLGWLQLKKSQSRLLVAIAGIGFADLLMFAQLGIQAALFDSNTMLSRGMDADIIIRSAQYRDLSLAGTLPRRRLYQIKDIPGVQSAAPVYVSTVVWKNPQTRRQTQLTLAGQNLDRPAFTFDEVNQNLDRLKAPDTFLFDRLSRGEYAKVVTQVAAGKSTKTEINRRTIEVTGLFSLGASFATDGTIITSSENFLRFFPERSPAQITLGLIKVNPGVDSKSVLADIQAILPADTIASTKQQYVDDEQAYWQKTTPIGIVFTFGTVMAFVVGMVIVFQILSTDVNEHMSEYATFKAMGYRDRYLLMIVLEQALILASLGFIPGLALALGQYALLRNAAALPVAMTASRLVLVFSLTMVMCIVSGVIATRKLQAADPADNF
jgi:putative ABC transport system permease protein